MEKSKVYMVLGIAAAVAGFVAVMIGIGHKARHNKKEFIDTYQDPEEDMYDESGSEFWDTFD